jgi:septal ring factor EnvC (AmiA/AmiB activator)
MLSNDQNGLKKVIKRLKTLMKRSGTFRNGQKRSCTRSRKRSGTVDAERSGTPRNVRVGTQQRIGTKSEKLSRCVHGTLTFTFQKRKKHCNKFLISISE